MKKTQVSVVALAILLISGAVFYVFATIEERGNTGTMTRGSASSSNGSSSSSSTTLSSFRDTTLSSTVPIISTATTMTTVPASTSAGHGDWTTYHRDLARTGFDPSSNFTSILADWRSPILDGLVYAEPLVIGNDVLVVTENDSVYSLDAQSGAVVWRTHLGDPVPGSSLPCGNINPSGITGTPVIDASTRTLYAVAFLNPPHHQLFAIDVGSGRVLSQVPADATGSNPVVQQQRAALTLANGMVYVPYGGLNGDCGQYHGWIVGIKTDGSGRTISYQVPTEREGGIWAPSGAVVDSTGHLYVTSGNGASSSTFDHGNSVIQLSPSLQETGLFAPSNWSQLNEQDADLGSVGPAIVGSNALFQIGKEGVGYLLSMNSLGGIGGQLFAGNVCSGAGAYGGTAYAQPYLFVPCRDGLVALHISSESFSVAWRTTSFVSGAPIVTGAIVWTVDTSSSTIHAYRVGDGQEIFKADLGQVPHFSTPSSGAGRVFVVSGDQIAAFLLS